MRAIQVCVRFGQGAVLAFEFRELGFEVLDVFFSAFAKGALGGAVLGSAADAHVGNYFSVLSRV